MESAGICFFHLLPLMNLALLPFLYRSSPHYIIVSLGSSHIRWGIMATSQTHSCGIGDICDAPVMEQMATALHDVPFLAIDLVVARAHTDYLFPLTILCKEVLCAISRLNLLFSNNAEYCCVISCLNVSLLATISSFSIISKSSMNLRQAIEPKLCPSDWCRKSSGNKFHEGISFMTNIAPICHPIMLI